MSNSSSGARGKSSGARSSSGTGGNHHLSLVVGGVPAHTQPLTREGTGFSHNRVAPKIGPVLRTTDFDRVLHAWVGKLTGGVAPTALTLAYVDWVAHLVTQPGKQNDLLTAALHKQAQLASFAARCAFNARAEKCSELRSSDARFRGEGWGDWPFNVYAEAFLLGEEWWQQATATVQGVSQHHRDLLAFLARQLTDTCSPSNFPWSNPQVLRTTIDRSGLNLLEGMANGLEDLFRQYSRARPVGAENYIPGQQVAVTPGKVIHRNRLMELIQYSPQTGEVHAEPILIVPAWIMKYYILDLSPENSLIRYLVERGHTVFMISWINPGRPERDLGMDDYREMGVMAALDLVQSVVPEQKVHAVGYCLGGTLLSLSAAAMARDGDDRLATMTLFAAQVDFEEAGELLLFIDEAQLTFLENMMAEQGFLDKGQLSAAFNLLRSKDLIWSRAIDEYLEGRRQPMFDLMAWSADSTRLPFRMHSEYLRSFFLNNDLSEGRYMIGGEGVALTDIRAPIFAVGTEKDHIAPWRSVYKIYLYSDTDVTFVLTTGGHNAGVITPPGQARRYYRLGFRKGEDRYVHPARWYDSTPPTEGSWWPAWQKWLVQHSSGKQAPPAMGAPRKGIVAIEDAPGTYVQMP